MNRSFSLLKYLTISLVLLLCFLLCAPQLQNISLTPEEQNADRKTWETANKLIEYDYFSWIATDSLMKYKKADERNKIKGWIVTGNEINKTVVFGSINENKLLTNFQVFISNGKPIEINQNDTLYDEYSDAYKGFKAMALTRNKYKIEFDTLNIPFNSYVLFNNDTIAVYFFPGSTDNYVIVCGGYRCKYNRNDLSEIECLKLHKSPLVLEKPPEDAVGSVRTSSNSNLLNEVDIAQCIIYKNRLPNQFVITKKYIFSFSTDKNTGEIKLNSILENDNKK